MNTFMHEEFWSFTLLNNIVEGILSQKKIAGALKKREVSPEKHQELWNFGKGNGETFGVENPRILGGRCPGSGVKSRFFFCGGSTLPAKVFFGDEG